MTSLRNNTRRETAKQPTRQQKGRFPETQETAVADKANARITYILQALVQWFAARDLFAQVSG